LAFRLLSLQDSESLGDSRLPLEILGGSGEDGVRQLQ